MSAAAAHPAIASWPAREGCLVVGGRALTEIAAEIGGTPFYIYERERIRARVAELRAAIPATVELHYAIKANPMPALVAFMARLVDGFDVASAGELEVALGAGMPAARVSFAGPGKRDGEIAAAVAAGVLLNAESETELARIALHAERLGTRARVAIRVNPDFELKSSGMKMGGGAKPFGIDAERVPEALRGLDAARLGFEGFHIYAGSQNLRAESICEAQEKSVAMALRLAEHAPAPVRVLNIGGGFGIPYFPGERPLELAPIGDALARLAERTAGALPEARLVLELGRYLVGEAGLYVCRVIDRKMSRGQVFLVTDGGLHHHLAASGNFGQVVRRNYPVTIGNRMGDAERECATIVGPLCTPLDVLADRAEIPRGEVGDLVVVFQSGAYGRTASPVAFLGHPPPREELV